MCGSKEESGEMTVAISGEMAIPEEVVVARYIGDKSVMMVFRSKDRGQLGFREYRIMGTRLGTHGIMSAPSLSQQSSWTIRGGERGNLDR